MTTTNETSPFDECVLFWPEDMMECKSGFAIGYSSSKIAQEGFQERIFVCGVISSVSFAGIQSVIQQERQSWCSCSSKNECRTRMRRRSKKIRRPFERLQAYLAFSRVQRDIRFFSPNKSNNCSCTNDKLSGCPTRWIHSAEWIG